MLQVGDSSGSQVEGPVFSSTPSSQDVTARCNLLADAMTSKLALILLITLSLASCAVPPTATPVPETAARPAVSPESKSTDTPLPPPPTASEAVKVAETAAPQAPTVQQALARLEPHSFSIDGSTPVSVDVVLDDLVDLYGVEVHLAFDPALVKVADSDPDFPGVQTSPGSAFPSGSGFVALNQVDNDQGTIDFAVTLLNPAKPLHGTIVVASFSMQGVSSGSVDIKFAQVLLADRDGNPLRVSSEGVTLAVKP